MDLGLGNSLSTRNQCNIKHLMGGKPRQNAAAERRGPGKPRRVPPGEGKLAKWIDDTGQSRAVLARQLGIGQPHLDALCREDRRPSIVLAIKINELAGDSVPLSYFTTVVRKKD